MDDTIMVELTERVFNGKGEPAPQQEQPAIEVKEEPEQETEETATFCPLTVACTALALTGEVCWTEGNVPEPYLCLRHPRDGEQIIVEGVAEIIRTTHDWFGGFDAEVAYLDKLEELKTLKRQEDELIKELETLKEEL
ncbi:MAG: hypothetical protein ABEK59_00895 [Halobacteria archaeon]